MNYIESFILGIIQGLTEFLPISSSGHLVVAQNFLGVDNDGMLVEVILHLGTLISILIYYYKDLKKLIINYFKGYNDTKVYVHCLIIATLPAVIVGFLFRGIIENTFVPSLVKWMFIITGIFVGLTYFIKVKYDKKMVWKIAIIIGLAQVFALLPGISRSGITISCALLLGINHENAAKFSFYMAIPILVGATILQLISLDSYNEVFSGPIFVAFISSTISGYLVINFLLKIISRGKFYLFSFYCFALSISLFFINI
tara:strand:- start:118 stop:888 length:771 start_codon:yes stop_codon:yes gene_type:complete